MEENSEPPSDVDSCEGGASEDEALADVRALTEDVEALGLRWDALTQRARDTVAELARACDAAIALVEIYRTPPRHGHETGEWLPNELSHLGRHWRDVRLPETVLDHIRKFVGKLDLSMLTRTNLPMSPRSPSYTPMSPS